VDTQDYFKAHSRRLDTLEAGSSGTKIITGTYTGNDTVNRAIAHGIGKIPAFIFIEQVNYFLCWNVLVGYLLQHIWSGRPVVTAPDSNNFYVGNSDSYEGSANAGGISYKWIAIG
jgi:hypothetical protein